jgi:hypothetical protein
VPPYRAIAIIGCFKTYLYPPTQIDLPANAWFWGGTKIWGWKLTTVLDMLGDRQVSSCNLKLCLWNYIILLFNFIHSFMAFLKYQNRFLQFSNEIDFNTRLFIGF